MISKSCTYAIRALIYLAKSESKGFVSIRELSNELDISFHFLAKILQALAQKGILLSEKGPKGGLKLLVPPERLTIKEIIIAVDGNKLFEKCMLGFDECSDAEPCALHDIWIKLRTELNRNIQNLSLTFLTKKINSSNRL
ncbi:Rrf2 family transcriptional regulator [candidate division KSB1 bacterium]|nr:Rrf2 family transcriptional regulator [candidate division KSB1 bacterium]